MITPLDLTIAIPVKNEEINLKGCFTSIGQDLAKEIVVIDSGSTDRTKEIALQNGAVVLDFDWNGNFPKKRNWFLRNYNIKTKWILFLDADEYLTDDFKLELRQVISDNTPKAGYWLQYTIFFMGKQLKGGYPLKKLALFKAGAGEYEKIDEERWSGLDMEIHEHPILKGEVGRMKSKIDHRDFRGISHYVTKHNEYASWEAGRFLKSFEITGSKKNWTWKQKIKYRLMKSVFVGPAYFFGSFFLLGGFKDGVRGFAFAIFKMAYFTQIYCKIREAERFG